MRSLKDIISRLKLTEHATAIQEYCFGVFERNWKAILLLWVPSLTYQLPTFLPDNLKTFIFEYIPLYLFMSVYNAGFTLILTFLIVAGCERLPKGLKPIAGIVIFSNWLLAFFNAICYFMYGSPVNQFVVGSIMDASAQNAYEYFLEFAASAHTFRALTVMALLAGIAFTLNRYKLPVLRFIKPVINILPILIFYAVVLRVNGNAGASKYMPPVYFLLEDTLPVLSIPSEITCTYIMDGDAPRIIDNFKSRPERYVAVRDDLPDIVVVIGESATKNLMNVYGYPVPNTPFLSGSPYVTAYPDIKAPYSATMPCLRAFFTIGLPHKMYKDWESYPNVLWSLQDVYETYWISNQSNGGMFGQTEKVIAELCHHNEFTNTKLAIDESCPYDEALLPIFEKVLSEKTDKPKFIVLHLMGSHMIYRYRYPESFNKFTASDEILDNPKYNQVRAEYDNSLLYTDYILEQVWKISKAKNPAILYFSDHGNEVFSRGDRYGHTGTLDPDVSDIPFITINTKLDTDPGLCYLPAAFQQFLGQYVKLEETGTRPQN